MSEQVMQALLPPTALTQAAAARIVLIGLVLALMLLFRPEGILAERRIVSHEARLPRAPPES